MMLQHYQIASIRNFFGMPKSRQNHTEIVAQKLRRHCSIGSIANHKVSQVDNHLVIYQPTMWSPNFIKSLETNFPMNCMEMENVKELEEKVMKFFIDYENGGLSTLQLLELIDNIERLGLGYRFQANITKVLNKITSMDGNNVGVEEDEKVEDSLHVVSLRFRLLRQYGYKCQDFHWRFKDSRAGFIGCLQTNIKGLLSLYEASYLAFEGERDLHEANLFVTECLLQLKNHENEVVDDINHALDIPLYRRMLRLQARCSIDAYAKQIDANQLLLELATLDFNMVQSAHKSDLQEVSIWWENIGLARKLSFIRDRLMECFFWSIGLAFEPQYHLCRVELTKVNTLITTMDDIYDVYGSLEELNIFTDAIKRWDINEVKNMPENFQISFLALYNTINEMGYNTLIGQGENIIPILGKVWGELSEAFLVEAKWTHSKYMPTLEEYLNNAWRSASGVVILTHGYFLVNQEIRNDAVESLEKCHDLLKWSSMILRLCNDLATSFDEMERGEIANAISCYMHESGVCEDAAHEYVKTLIDEAWRKLIEARVACSREFSKSFIDMAINLARTSHCVYQYGDGHGAPDARTKDRVLSVIIEPIALKGK